MAICFVKSRYVSRSSGGNACRTSAYNARDKIVDERTGEVFDFSDRGDNVYHEVILPQHVDKKFKNISILSNEVERNERRKDSQVYVEWVLALPKEKEISLEMKQEMINRFIEKKGWLQEGLGMQIDIHSPHDKNDNEHCHILKPTRRFTKDGKGFERLKARDLEPKILGGKVEETKDSIAWAQIQNDYFKENGFDLRVDLPNKITQEHVGPVRMRSVMNEAVYRNEERAAANIKHLNSGKRVLESITAHMSVFSKSDLERVVKIVPDAAVRAKLVEDALASKSLILLHDENGKATGSYTTNEVRSEEAKLLRLGGYINSSKNLLATGNEKSRGIVAEMVESARGSLTEEQHSALSHLLLGEGGVRILRGRAGTGKSYVLGKVSSIAKGAGLNVIGLAPTHKARSELASRGYEQNDTIKGMLFKLNNGRFELPKGSLLVVDEAGMVGNDDFKELLRVAAGLKCNVILSGDERQIASVQRGGMFEVFAEKYGSASILNIQRQKNVWGREVAMALSKGEVRSGVSILEANGKILEASTKNESMQSLLADWSKSKEKIADRVILAVKNADVTALNHGARQYLKLSGDLRGNEVSVAGHYYMKGDRVLIKETNKKLGLVNGDFATVMHASRDRFVLGMESVDSADTSNDNKKLVEFNPSAYSGFRHGYATTIFKAQGASIREVFVFHDGFAGIRNSYVALSRNVENLRLYINNEATKSINHLIKQLGHDSEIGSSLSYFTKQELADKELDAEFEKGKGLVGSMIMSAFDFTAKKITAFNDKHFIDNAYYKYVAPKFQKQSVEEVLEKVGEEMEQEAIGSSVMLEQKAVVGGSPILNHTSAISNEAIANNKISITPKAKQSAKERFYKRADYVRAASSQENRAQQKAQWDVEAERLRNEVKFKAEIIARNLLGDPNKSLSDRKTLRFGEHGKIAVRISGDRVGNWFDFSADKGGDMFALVQDRQGCDFKGAAEYLRKSVGMEASNNSHLKLVNIHRTKDLTEKHIQAKAEEERVAKAKAEHVEKLYARAKDIGDRSVAYRYLTKHRGLDFSGVKSISNDIKTTGIYVGSDKNSAEKGKHLPVLVAFARDSEGRVTGGQQVFLDKNNGAKADIAVPKKSFGKIAGSFVHVGNIVKPSSNKDDLNGHTDKVTIIAEGLETGMSIEQSLSEHKSNVAKGIKTLCSLGISNIKNYSATPGEKIIIAADNDGVDSNTSKTIENAKVVLENKGAFVEVVQPSREGDFNDVLKLEGSTAISNDFEVALSKHVATTLKDYLAWGSADNQSSKMDQMDAANLAYIEKYNLPQNAIVDAYRKSDICGKLELEDTRKGLEMATKHYSNNIAVLKEAKQWGYQDNEIKSVKSLIGLNEQLAVKHCSAIRDGALAQHIENNLIEYREQKQSKKTLLELKPVIQAEQKFFKDAYQSIQAPMEQHSIDNQKHLEVGRVALAKPEASEELFKLAGIALANGAKTESSLIHDLQNIIDMKSAHDKIGGVIEGHNIKEAMNAFDVEIDKSKSLATFKKALGDKQSYLSDRQEKLEYPKHLGQELSGHFKESNQTKEVHTVDKFSELAKKSMDIHNKTEPELLKDLRGAKDLSSACKKMGGEMESDHLRQNISVFDLQNYNAKTPIEAATILTRRQSYFAGVRDKLEYPNEIDAGLIKIIEAAKLDIHNNENDADKLSKLTSFVAGEKLYHLDDGQIVDHLKKSTSISTAVANLTSNYQKAYLKDVSQDLSTIEQKGEIKVRGKSYSSSTEYLTENIRRSHQEYAPQQELQDMLKQTAEQQNQKEGNRGDFER
ncbi:AAA family ATPase [Rickettsiaceae bacterium]|nr:AAA family ATPase [Rickettsiaceae bacterium]